MENMFPLQSNLNLALSHPQISLFLSLSFYEVQKLFFKEIKNTIDHISSEDKN